MKIQVFADFHRTDFTLLKLNSPDVIICAGDCFGNPDQVDERLASFSRNIPILVTVGNHDFGIGRSWIPKGDNVHNLLAQTTTINNVIFGGFGWCYCSDMPELATIWMRMSPHQEVMREKTKNIPVCDVLVSHSPPAGILDNTYGRKIGVPGLWEKCVDNGTELVLCGHVHEDGGKSAFQDPVKVINTACCSATFEYTKGQKVSEILWERYE